MTLEPIQKHQVLAVQYKNGYHKAKSDMGGVYCLSINGFLKVGMSVVNCEYRASSQMTVPGISLVWTLKTDFPRYAEALGHYVLSQMGERYAQTEWYKVGGDSAQEVRQKIIELL